LHTEADLLLDWIRNENLEELKKWIKQTKHIDFAYPDEEEERYEDYPTLLHAVEYEKENVVKLLLEAGVNANLRTSDGQTALYRAIEKQCFPIVALLLEYGADVQQIGRFDKSPLFCAVDEYSQDKYYFKDENDRQYMKRKKKKLLIIKALLEKGADPNKQEISVKLTPLKCAQQRVEREIIEILENKN